MTMDTDLEVISVFGARGSGKTTRVKELIKDSRRKRVIIYDLKDEYPLMKLRGISEFAQFMAQDDYKKWFGAFNVSYVPGAREKTEHIAELSKLCYALADAQKDDASKGCGGNLTIVVEEMSVCAPNQRYPDGQGGFEYVVNIAREWGIEIIGVCQRPAQANPDFRGNATNNYFYALTDRLDTSAIKEKIGENAEKVRLFKPHEYIHFHHGTIKEGKNKSLSAK